MQPRKFLVFKGNVWFPAGEFVDIWCAQLDQKLGLPNADTQTYCDGGESHPDDPEYIYGLAIQILDWVEPYLTEEEREQLVTEDELRADGWFRPPAGAIV